MKDSGHFCPALWFSGFFGLGFVMHTLRLLFQVPVTVGAYAVPFSVSMILMVVFGVLSGGLLYLGCRKPCCDAGGQKG